MSLESIKNLAEYYGKDGDKMTFEPSAITDEMLKDLPP